MFVVMLGHDEFNSALWISGQPVLPCRAVVPLRSTVDVIPGGAR